MGMMRPIVGRSSSPSRRLFTLIKVVAYSLVITVRPYLLIGTSPLRGYVSKSIKDSLDPTRQPPLSAAFAPLVGFPAEM